MYGSDGCGEIVIGPQVLAGVAVHNFDTLVALRLGRILQVVCATRRLAATGRLFYFMRLRWIAGTTSLVLIVLYCSI